MNIGFLAHGPGTANAISRLIIPLKDLGHDIYEFPFTPYAKEMIGGELFSEDYYLNIFSDYNLDLIVTGTGSMHEVEKNVPVLARYYGIKIVSILDAVVTGNVEFRYFNKPDYVICLNEEHKFNIIKYAKLDEDRVLSLGNPYLDIYERYKDINPRKLEVNNQQLRVVYASEPSGSRDMNDTSMRSKIVISELVDLIKEGILGELVICTHPRESKEWLEDTYGEESGVTISSNKTMDEVFKSDLCVNIGSTVHYECLLSKIPSIIYKRRDLFLYELYNYTHKDLNINFGATERVVKFIDSLTN